ncbi:SAM-dependent methyltransferase [Bacteroidia bacterium]|nr:SAM-dependent methyltransferase [Bacteroidia bacterium]
MQKRHLDRRQYFNEQRQSTKKDVVPYIYRHKKLDDNSRVLEIGCGEGGNLYPFAELGCECYGVELSQTQVNNAVDFYKDTPVKNKITLICQNIYDTNPEQLGGEFDVVFLKDVIEHIPNQEKFMSIMKSFLKPDGVAFFAFPPWNMPFGGHHQSSPSKLISHFPYLHIMPKFLQKIILKLAKHDANYFVGISSTGISIERFERILKAQNYHILQKTFWLFNPNYQVKYGLPPAKVWKIFQIPYLQNFYTTAAYYVIKKCC